MNGTVPIRINKDNILLSKRFCREEGKILSDLVNNALSEYLEDWYDNKIGTEALKEHIESGSKGIDLQKQQKEIT